MSIPRALLAAAALTLASPLPAAAQPAACRTEAPSDLDGDGFSDLAVAAPYDTVNDKPRAGTVTVFHGSPGGLTKATTLARATPWPPDRLPRSGAVSEGRRRPGLRRR